jgi:hypothetical protein
MHTAKIVSVSLMFGLALIATACGDSKSSLNPTAPSALSADSLSVEADAAAAESGAMANGPKPGNGNGNGNGNNGGGNGNGNGGGGNGNGNGNQPRTPTNTSPTTPTAPVAPGKSKVEFEGLLQAVGGGSITVNGQVITVTLETVIRHGNRTFELSDLHVGDRVHVRAMRVAPPADGSTVLVETTLQASVILVQNPGDATDPGEGEDDGLVSVAAFDASAVEGVANNGVFRLTRTGTLAQLASSLTVTFTLTGTAANGVDYTSVPLSATFEPNQSSVDVTIAPLVDNTVEGGETVVLTLTDVAPFELGSPIAATVTITDSANPLVSVTATDATARESGDTGRFVLVRTGNLASQLTVTITLTGAAVNGTDYDVVETTVTFAANMPTANVFIIPVADAVTDPSESVILTVVDGASYDLGASSTATVTISGS